MGYLDYQRATLWQKVSGLDGTQLARVLPPSDMTLGGMLKHCALNEDYWFCHRAAGGPEGEPWDSVDWDADRDWDWHSAAQDSPEELLGLWHAAVERARAAVADIDLATPAVIGRRDGERPSLRWIVVHMVEEYARHNGHADLIRESIDGVTGE
ncbi:DinB family protein [Nocardioides mangrovicus]|uniref:DinB family protein n=2 Tax=Nocardioides mangrovicus TaxID=2478913 RepID=A0A3L8P7A8_9ACTN|nr:DinB family protein [Nocardioides mangrovicus]